MKGKLFLMAAAQAILRLFMMALLIVGIAAHPVFLPLALMALQFGVLPGKFLFSKGYRKEEMGKEAAKKALFLGLRRGSGVLYCFPVVLFAAWFFHIYKTMPYTQFGQTVKKFAFLVFSAPSPDKGALGVAVAFVLLMALAVFGWQRLRYMEYLPWDEKTNPEEMQKRARKTAKEHTGKWVGLHAVNGLLALPGLMAFGFILLRGLFSKGETGGLFALLQNVLGLVAEKPGAGQVLGLIAVYFLVHTPLVYLRKVRLCRAVAQIEKETGA